MNSIFLRLTQEVVQRLNQMSIRNKVALNAPISSEKQPEGHSLTDIQSDNTVFAFNIMFERNNPESEWRLVTPLKFTE